MSITRSLRTAAVIAAFTGYAAMGLAVNTAKAADTGSLTVTFEGVKSTTGQIMVALYDSDAQYASGKPVRALALPVTGSAASATVEGLAPGRYAIKAFHDVDGDGKMSTNPFGMPTEPFAFSNDAPVMMGPPPFDKAAFEVKAGANAAKMHID